MKKSLKKLKFYLQHVDGIWSVPLVFVTFWIAGIVLQWFGGYGVGTYDPGFIQPLFLSIGIVIGATNAAIGGLFFTFRGMYRYLYGQRDEKGSLRNYSKENWLKLTAWQRFAIVFFVFFYYVSAVIIVYLHLV
jgi:hypothetical protein